MNRTGVLLAMLLLLTSVGCGKKAPSTDYEDVDVLVHKEYTVRPGDTWTSISADFFGRDDRGGRIAAENDADPAVAPDPGRVIRIGIRPDELDLVRRMTAASELYNVGCRHRDEGRHEEAVQAFAAALEKAPEFVDARYNLGLALLKVGRPREALDELEVVADARPDDADARYALASAWFHLGDYPRSVPELEAALALRPELLRPRYTLALALERMGESQRARRAWEEYLRRDSTSAWAQEARSHLEALP
jgi:tetratricopeptide (TPR) repeat protein